MLNCFVRVFNGEWLEVHLFFMPFDVTRTPILLHVLAEKNENLSRLTT